MGTVDEKRIAATIAAQTALLVAVAEATRTKDNAASEYVQHHKQLYAVAAGKFECLCPWRSVAEWLALSEALGDPAWREYLAKAIATYEARTIKSPVAPTFPSFGYHRNGSPTDVPFTRSLARLESHKQVALKQAIRNRLEVLGPGVIVNEHWGEWINYGNGKRVLEFKVAMDAADLPWENPDGSPRTSGYPKEKINLRVGCCQADDGKHMVLFDVFDKGADANGQEAAKARWLTMLKDYRQQEAVLRKRSRRQPC
jgi:hypothetical protein